MPLSERERENTVIKKIFSSPYLKGNIVQSLLAKNMFSFNKIFKSKFYFKKPLKLDLYAAIKSEFFAELISIFQAENVDNAGC